MTPADEPIDWSAFEAARARFGTHFLRVLGYLREDGRSAVSAIESAVRAGDAVGLVRPACVLKDGAYDVGAEALGEAAERIEAIARRCVEVHDTPDEALPAAAGLRALFNATVARMEEEASPLLQKVVRRTA